MILTKIYTNQIPTVDSLKPINLKLSFFQQALIPKKIEQKRKLSKKFQRFKANHSKKSVSFEFESRTSKTISKFIHLSTQHSTKKCHQNLIRMKINPTNSLNKIQYNGRKQLLSTSIQSIQFKKNNEIVQHLIYLQKILISLKSFEDSNLNTIQHIQKIATSYYQQESIIQSVVQKSKEHLKRQFKNTVNIQRTFIICLITFCLNNKLKTNLIVLKKFLQKLIQQYKNIGLQIFSEQNKKNNLDIFSNNKFKFKSRNPYLMIKSENYQLDDQLNKIISKLEIYESLIEIYKNAKQQDPKQYWYLLREYYAYHLTLLNLDRIVIRQIYWPLASCPPPYLPHYQNYTLVLDLDQTLVHYNQKGEVLIRPYANQFIQSLKDLYQIVIFTAGMPDYADFIIDHLDAKQHISYKLYRYHTTRIQNQKSIKDLSRLGRPLQKLILIDNISENYCKQIHNGIEIKSWYGDQDDDQLKKLTSHLKDILEKQMDVRQYIEKVFYKK